MHDDVAPLTKSERWRRWKAVIEASYRDETRPERACDRCAKPYRGPAVYCSHECAIEDAE